MIVVEGLRFLRSLVHFEPSEAQRCAARTSRSSALCKRRLLGAATAMAIEAAAIGIEVQIRDNGLLISCFGEDPDTCRWDICQDPLYLLPLEPRRRSEWGTQAIGVLNELGAR